MAKYLVKEEIGKFYSDSAFTNSVRLISWYEKNPKVDIGQWSAMGTEQEYRKKGIALSVNETNSLTELLVDKGFGNKNTLLESIKNRKIDRVEDMVVKDDEVKEDIKEDNVDEYYDPKEMLI